MTQQGNFDDTLAWRDDLLLGDPTIDDQHKFMFTLLEKLVSTVSTSDLDGIIYDLEEYTKAHFSHEEKMQSESQYPKLEEHRKLHEALGVQLNVVKGKITSGTLSSYVRLRVFLEKWVREHILNADKEFIEYYRDQKK